MSRRVRHFRRFAAKDVGDTVDAILRHKRPAHGEKGQVITRAMKPEKARRIAERLTPRKRA